MEYIIEAKVYPARKNDEKKRFATPTSIGLSGS